MLTLVVVLSSSCTQHKQLVYLKSLDSVNAESYFPKSRPEYRIQTRDILYIRIYTLNQDISNLINQTMGTSQQNLFQNEPNLYINGYTVNDSGFVEIPVLGRIEVANKTMDQAINAIRERAARYLKDATVIVKLVSFKFSVLGEVGRPGTYSNFNNQLTVLEAISMAGDITDFGNRKQVLVLRPTKDGTKTFRLDLTDISLLTSDGFFLLPNDIVYVEPIKSKMLKINLSTISLFLTGLSTLILILNFTNNL
ncbi:MAG: polysaccharide biosynthesis/export family protein [Bacteroidales bacterium]|nr:polysaccharide biosynthesis/export family protein [Bacteroidales bacterium]